MLKDALGSYRGTLGEVDRIVAATQDNAMAFYDRANLKHCALDHAGAIEDYTYALSIGLRKREEYMALGNRAMAASELGQYDAAVGDYTRIIEANPRNKGVLKTALLRRAELFNRIGRTEAADRDNRAAEEITKR